jgi:Clp amino terminal domain, pathogenicity island component
MHTRFDTESRIAVAQAADIARELGHREVGPGHLLAGLLANPRGTAYAALRDHGLDLDSARDLVAAHHVDTEARPQAGPEAGRETRDSGYEEDRDALKAIGIDLDAVREAVRANLGDDLAEGWAARPDRGSRRDRRRGRGRRGHHHGEHHHAHHDHHDHHEDHLEGHEGHEGRGRGRRGPRSRREGPRFSPELVAILREVRRSVLRDRPARESGDDARRQPAMTGARMLVALTQSEDPAVQAVLATATGVEGLRAQAESAVRPAATA